MNTMNEIKELLKELVFTKTEEKIEMPAESKCEACGKVECECDNFEATKPTDISNETTADVPGVIKNETVTLKSKQGIDIFYNNETGEVWTVDGENAIKMAVGIYELEDGSILTVTEEGIGVITKTEEEKTEEVVNVEMETDKYEARFAEIEAKFETLSKLQTVLEKFSEKLEGLNSKFETMANEPATNPIDLAPKIGDKKENDMFTKYVEQAKREYKIKN